MELVWRVEHKEHGIGPYHWGGLDLRTRMHLYHLSERPHRPSPWGEQQYGKVLTPAWRCGFRTKTQLKRWFTPKLRQGLHEAGYVVRLVRAKKVKHLTYQSIFHAESATVEREWRLTEI